MRTLTEHGITWVDLINPPPGELRQLQQKYGFHELDIEDCLSEHERPKVDEYERYLFIVLHIPYEDPTTGRLEKDEVDIFLGHDYVITLHEGKLKVLEEFWTKLEASDTDRVTFLRQGTGYFLYELAEHLFASVFPIVDQVNRERRAIERRLFETKDQQDMLRAILDLKRKVIVLRNILVPQRSVVASLEHKYSKFSPEALEVYFQNIVDAIERQTLLVETAREVVDALQDTHTAWIQHRTNQIIRILTILSVVLLPLNLLTGMYGMNVRLPLAEEPWIFEGILFIIVLFFLGSFWFFSWKRWW